MGEFGEKAMTGISEALMGVGPLLMGDILASALTIYVAHRLGMSLLGYYDAQLALCWHYIALVQCWSISTIICMTFLHCRNDFSFKFSWLDHVNGTQLVHMP